MVGEVRRSVSVGREVVVTEGEEEAQGWMPAVAVRRLADELVGRLVGALYVGWYAETARLLFRRWLFFLSCPLPLLGKVLRKGEEGRRECGTYDTV